MAESANVQSIQALKQFRITLVRVIEQIRTGLIEAEAELDRVSGWVKQDQARYWKSELRRRSEEMNRARIALKVRQIQKTPLGGRYSCVDEEKAFEAAKRKHEEAQAKQENVKRWDRKLDEEVFDYKGMVQGLDQMLESEMPKALARLDQMLRSLDAYVALSDDGGGDLSSMQRPADGQENGISIARGGQTGVGAGRYESLIDRAPDGAARQRLVPEEMPFCWLAHARVSRWQVEAMSDLELPSVVSEPDDKVILADGDWNQTRIFFHRLPSVPSGDSGWFVGLVEQDTRHRYRATTVGQLLAARSDWEAFLAFPPGCIVVFNGMAIETVIDPKGETLWPMI